MKKSIIIVSYILITILNLSCKERPSQIKQEFDEEKIQNLIERETPISETNIAYQINTEGNKFFTISESVREQPKLVNLKYYENIGQNFTKINSLTFQASKEEGIIYSAFDTIKQVMISDEDYFLSKLYCSHQGRAYEGYLHQKYVFYNIKKDSFIQIDYTEWLDDMIGSFDSPNSKLSERKQFVEYINNFEIDKEDINLNNPNNYYLSWLDSNRGIYDKIENSNVWYDINFKEITKEEFYNFFENGNGQVEMYRSDEYFAIAGFRNPIFIYNKYSSKGYMVFVPQGYPNGAAWGGRSFDIDSITTEGILGIINPEIQFLAIDLKNRKIKSYEL